MFKRYQLILLITTLSLGLNSQPFGEASEGFRITKSLYQNSGGERGSTVFNYNFSGTLISAIWSLEDKSRSSINHYQYDENGLHRTTSRVFSDSLTSFELFTYDSDGKMVSEKFSRSDGINGSAVYQYEETRLKQAYYLNHKGWLKGEVKYSYLNDRKHKAAIFKKDTLICNISYTFNKDKNLVKEHWDFLGRWSQTFNYEYEKIEPSKYFYSNPYVSKSNKYRVIKESYTYNYELGGPSIYKYDKDGLMNKKTFTRTDGLTTTTTYNYDPKRRLISSSRLHSNQDCTEFTYEYDRMNNLILRTSFKNDSVIGFESYQYEEGKLCKAHLKNFDNWISGDLIFYYNQFNQLDYALFRGLDGFDAQLNFTFNKDNLLSEILWHFSFGKFQQYKFQYEAVHQ